VKSHLYVFQAYGIRLQSRTGWSLVYSGTYKHNVYDAMRSNSTFLL